MFRHLYTLSISLLFSFTSYAQWSDEFTDSNLSEDPSWITDLSDWTVEDDQLKLNATEPGSSLLQTQYNLSAGVGVWEISIDLDYAPSNNNYFEWYLYTDQSDLTNASGYYLRIGRNGSDDSVELYELLDGESALLGMGTDGIAGSAPVILNIQVVVNESGEWSIYTRTGELDPYNLEIFTVTDPISNNSDAYHSILATYTSSNVDATAIDYVRYATMIAEEPEGMLTSLTVNSPTELLLQFNKALDLDAAADVSNYAIDGLVIGSASPGAPRSGLVTLTLESALINGREYELDYMILDDQGEAISGSELFESLFGDEPDAGDLVITEVMPDPIGSESDYIEIYNTSDKTFDLRDFIIDNASSSNNPADITVNEFLRPGQYVAFTEDKQGTIDRYNPIADANILEQNLPSFSNSDGNVSIIYRISNLTVASVDYTEDWHVNLVSDPEGISLERILIDGADNDSENWSSSSNQGTPGYENTQNAQVSSSLELTVEPETISPDLDGRDDFALISLGDIPNETIGSVRVYSVYGHLVKTLRNNQLLSASVPVRWDGFKEDGTRAELGGYIVLLDYFTPTGITGSKKGTVVVALPLD